MTDGKGDWQIAITKICFALSKSNSSDSKFCSDSLFLRPVLILFGQVSSSSQHLASWDALQF